MCTHNNSYAAFYIAIGIVISSALFLSLAYLDKQNQICNPEIILGEITE